jgi:hypothetical protein
MTMPAAKKSNRSRSPRSRKPYSGSGTVLNAILSSPWNDILTALNKLSTLVILIVILTSGVQAINAINSTFQRLSAITKPLENISPRAGRGGLLRNLFFAEGPADDPYQQAHPECYEPTEGEPVPKVEDAPCQSHLPTFRRRRGLFGR